MSERLDGPQLSFIFEENPQVSLEQLPSIPEIATVVPEDAPIFIHSKRSYSQARTLQTVTNQFRLFCKLGGVISTENRASFESDMPIKELLRYEYDVSFEALNDTDRQPLGVALYRNFSSVCGYYGLALDGVIDKSAALDLTYRWFLYFDKTYASPGNKRKMGNNKLLSQLRTELRHEIVTHQASPDYNMRHNHRTDRQHRNM